MGAKPNGSFYTEYAFLTICLMVVTKKFDNMTNENQFIRNQFGSEMN